MFYYLIICIDGGVHWFFEVFSEDNPSKLRLGFPWKEFCSSNGFNARDTIHFKFSMNNLYKRCHVFKFD